MSKGDDWWGKPLRSGYQTQIMAFLGDHPDGSFTVAEISQKLDAPENSIGACMSTLTREGWTVRAHGMYRAAPERPVEDKSRVVYRANVRKAPKTVAAFEPGTEYIIKCIAIDSKGQPVIQKEDDSRLFRVQEV